MASAAKSPPVLLISGDVTVDWNLARSRRSESGGACEWTADDSTRAYRQSGGASLLADLVKAVARECKSSGADWEVRSMAAPAQAVRPGDARYHHSYAMWSLFKYGEHPPFDKEQRVWRVEEFLGLDARTSNDQEKESSQKIVGDTSEASIVILDDADLGFRKRPELWPNAVKNKKQCPWILLKMARPVASGELWRHLHETCADRLIVVMTVNDLRLTEVQISRELSWERTAQDLAWELVYNPRVNALSHCAHVVVSFDTAGAILLSGTKATKTDGRVATKCTLFFDPKVIEGVWQQNHRGGMIGYTSCLTAGIAGQLMLSPDKPNIEQGIQSGLAAMRKLHLEGYGRRGSTVPQAQLAFPVEVIAKELVKESFSFAVAEVQDPVRFLTPPQADEKKAPEGGFWTILEDRYTGALAQVAEEIVLRGAEAVLKNVPLGQFGKLLTVDRQEIESFRSIRALVGEYCRQSRPKRPLSIAVFGAPGAGKSFGVTEVAKSLLPDQIESREFNLSQFRTPEEILDALHQVRDVGLSGKLPLVFWDEFDTSFLDQPLGWLRYFLAPMQDGKFQQGQITHPIGRAVFVFAGGTSETMEAFDKGAKDEAFKAVKGPDFVSRLKGYVNILGPNRQESRDDKTEADPYYIIRRAILLRSILYRDARQLFHKDEQGSEVLRVDPGVLRALLHTRRYQHGVRSMESIIAMSVLTGKSQFERSSLPAEAQLDLHVDAQNFLSLVQSMDLRGELLDKLAEAAHEVFCAGLRAKGYRLGPKTDDKRKVSSALVPYQKLPDDEKEQNRGNVRDIANKLALIGYVMRPARSNEPPFNFPGPDLESVAEMEHERWMRQKLEAGWRYAPKTDKKKKLHEALLPWRKLSQPQRARLYSPFELAVGGGVLSESQRRKDRMLVRGIPKILSRAGYTVVKVQGESAKEVLQAVEGRSDGHNRSHGA
ncbi:MAG: RyR domain-containing protein, partial [Acidobacteriota bacterium]|nr:RyR domain-containing protein [Acidobacteriota bacterium]